MEAGKRKKILLVLMIFVAVIFLSSYAAFSNNNIASQTTTTISDSCGSTYLVFGSVNTILINYGDTAALAIGNKSYANAINSSLASLSNNGSIGEYFPVSYGYNIYLSSMNPYQLEQYFKLQSIPNLTVNSTVELTLPQTARLNYRNYSIPTNLGGKNISIVMPNPPAINSTVGVDLHALVYQNGSVCNGQLEVSLMSG